MTIISKTLIPNKEWILKFNEKKIGSITKNKKSFSFLKKGLKLSFKSLKEIQEVLGIELTEFKPPEKFIMDPEIHKIYDYPCSNKPFEPVYNLKKKLPLFAKSPKSKSQYCAGYYVIKFRKSWVKSFCPKLITLERYPYYGPFKTELEMRTVLNNVNKHETT